MNKEIDQLKATHPGTPPRAMVLNDAATPTTPHVFLRGNPGRPGKAVPRQFLAVLAGPNRQPFKDGSGRLEARPPDCLARESPHRTCSSTVSGSNASARASSRRRANFGRRSDPPSNQALLDWLAADFMAHDWSVKHLQRMILYSSTIARPATCALNSSPKIRKTACTVGSTAAASTSKRLATPFSPARAHLDGTIGGHGVPIGEPPFPPSAHAVRLH